MFFRNVIMRTKCEKEKNLFTVPVYEERKYSKSFSLVPSAHESFLPHPTPVNLSPPGLTANEFDALAARCTPGRVCISWLIDSRCVWMICRKHYVWLSLLHLNGTYSVQFRDFRQRGTMPKRKRRRNYRIQGRFWKGIIFLGRLGGSSVEGSYVEEVARRLGSSSVKEAI